MALIKTRTGQARHAYSKYTGERHYKYPNQPGVHKTYTHHQVIAVVGDIELTVDIQALLDYMGARALASKSGRATMKGGIAKAKVKKRTETPGPLRERSRGEHEIDVIDPN